MIGNILVVRLEVKRPEGTGVLIVERSEAPLIKEFALASHQVDLVLRALKAFVNLEE